MGLADRVLAGDQRAIARAISLVENEPEAAAGLLRHMAGRIGRARVLGVTGAPGVGKSTLVDGLAAEYRGMGRTVGILAIDPTSPISGGAILGDRVRMQRHVLDEGVYVRSMATHGRLGGPLARDRRRGAAAGCGGPGRGADRDRGRGPGGGGHRAHGGRLDRGHHAGRRRRRAGDEGRHHGNRGRIRREQAGPTGRGPRGGRDRGDAVVARVQRGGVAPAGAEDAGGDGGRSGRGGGSCGALRRPAGRHPRAAAHARTDAPDGPAAPAVRPSAWSAGRRRASCSTTRSSGMAAGEIDPYAAAAEIMEGAA